MFPSPHIAWCYSNVDNVSCRSALPAPKYVCQPHRSRQICLLSTNQSPMRATLSWTSHEVSFPCFPEYMKATTGTAALQVANSWCCSCNKICSFFHNLQWLWPRLSRPPKIPRFYTYLLFIANLPRAESLKSQPTSCTHLHRPGLTSLNKAYYYLLSRGRKQRSLLIYRIQMAATSGS